MLVHLGRLQAPRIWCRIDEHYVLSIDADVVGGHTMRGGTENAAAQTHVSRHMGIWVGR